MNYANWVQRAAGFIIDYIAVVILQIIANAVDSTAVTIVVSLLVLAYLIYNRWYLGGTTGQTFGRKVMKTKLINEASGQPIGAGMAFVRDLAHIVDSLICYIGWLFPLWDKKRQTIGDKIMKTVVVEA